MFSAVPRTSLHIVFIAAITALLHFLMLCLLPFWCGGLCAAHGIRRTARRCPGVSDQCVGYTTGNTCRIYLREGPPGPKDQRSQSRSKVSFPCWAYVGGIFRSWALLGRLLRLQLRLLSLLVRFCASWGAPGSISGGFGASRAWFWRSKTNIFRSFFAHASLQCEKLLIYKNHSFSLVFAGFLNIANFSHRPNNNTKSLQEPPDHRFP